MRAVLQRVTSAKVEVDGNIAGEIGCGLLVLVGFCENDSEKDLDYMTDKIVNLRIFEDDTCKMNISVQDIKGGILVVPNFTLYGDARKGRRPDFVNSASPETARVKFERFCEKLRVVYDKVETGIFKAEMKVSLLNDGPVTILLDSSKLF